ncbi:hypothetical protein M422DRAFT_91331, partial [Sphaerobolus stellatus SS14]
GGRSISSFNKTKSLLSDNKEELILEYALESAAQGFPDTLCHLEQKATDIIRSRFGPKAAPLGKNWVN